MLFFLMALGIGQGGQTELVARIAYAEQEGEPAVVASELQDRINAAVLSGGRWLEARLAPEALRKMGEKAAMPPGVYFGHLALGALAVVHSGVAEDRSVLNGVIDYLVQNHRSGQGTYGLGLMILLSREVDRLESEQEQGEIAARSKRLGWGRRLRLAARACAGQLRLHMRGGGWGYGVGSERGDLSNSEHAMLGLLAAQSGGMNAGALSATDLVDFLRQHLLELTEEDMGGRPRPAIVASCMKIAGGGGDGSLPAPAAMRYAVRGGNATGSASVSALVCLAGLCRLSESGSVVGLSPELRGQIQEMLGRVLTWIAWTFEPQGNPEVIMLQDPKSGRRPVQGLAGMWHGSYLIGVERACSLLGVEAFGDLEWYSEGAKFLVASQALTGEWRLVGPGVESRISGSGPYDAAFVDTCHAVLFLRRSTRGLGPSAAPGVKTGK